jgi:hypothetical protein
MTRLIQQHTNPRHSGQAMVEYLYVFPILAMLILGAIQFGFIYQAKITLDYAVFSATREGALNSGNINAINDGLISGLMPLFAHSLLAPNGTDRIRDMEMLKKAWKLARAQVEEPKFMEISIVNPTLAALSAYQSQSDSGKEIPNDNLMYRSTNITGSAGMNIQDANLLKVRVTYCYKMSVPILNRLIYYLIVDPPGAPPARTTIASDMLASNDGGTSTNTSRCIAELGADEEFRIPITAEAVVRMQSPFKNPFQSPFREPAKWTWP